MNLTFLNQWERISAIPKELQGRFESHIHSLLAYENSLYIITSVVNNTVPSIDYNILCFDLKTQSWHKVVTTGKLPMLLMGYSATIYKSSMFVFGGYKIYSSSTNDLVEYKFSTKEWNKWECTGKRLPKYRYNHGAVVYNDRLWIFYGIEDIERYVTDIWSIYLLNDNPHQWEQIEQRGDCPTEIIGTSVTVARQWIFFIGKNIMNDDKLSLYRFTFEDRMWSSFKDIPNLINGFGVKSKLVAYKDHLFILINQHMYCFNLDTEIVSEIKFTTNLNFEIYSYYGNAIASGDAIYFFDKSNQLFKFQPGFNDCTLRTDFKNVLGKQLLCNVEFLVGKEAVKFSAHIPIVVARSQWLRDCICPLCDFNGTTKDSSALVEVKLPNVIPGIFEMVLSYIYTDQIKLSKDLYLILDLYQLAGEIGLKRLQQLIIQQLTESNLKDFINPSNVLDVLSKAHLLNLRLIIEFCFKFINEDSNCEEIRMSEKLKTLEIFEQKEIPTNEPSVNLQPELESSDLRSLKSDMKVFMETFGNEFSDITLVLGEDEIPAHKCILAARSSYFEAMFRSFMPPDNMVRIQIGDIIPSKEAFNFLLKFIYYGEDNIPLEYSSELVAAPSFYQFTNKRLLELIIGICNKFGTFENMQEVLEAAEQAQEQEFKNYILELIENRIPRTGKQLRKRKNKNIKLIKKRTPRT